MKLLALMLLIWLAGCSTVGGAVKGLGEDVKRGTDYVAERVTPKNSNSAQKEAK